MTHTADELALAVGFGDLRAKVFGEPEVEAGAPTAGQEHDVVLGHVELADSDVKLDMATDWEIWEFARTGWFRVSAEYPWIATLALG